MEIESNINYNKKFTKSINVSDYEILTDTGWEDIKALHETIEYDVYEMKTESDKTLKCADYHILFLEDYSETFVKDLKIGDQVITKDGLEKITYIENLGYKEVMYDFELKHDSNKRYYTNDILSHNTTFAKLISESVFGSERNMVRLDMSEYKDSHSVSKLIGSPPGFVGYENGGVLTEEVKKHPHSVVLFDEVEKAHPDIFNLLLQVLDEGHIKDSLGNFINFKHTIIIMTSNLGSDVPETVGFKSDSAQNYINAVDKEIKKFFRVEFINRIDKIIYFNHLQVKDISNIYECELLKIKTKFEKHNINLKINNRLKTEIINRGYNNKYGVRFMKRTMHEMIIDNILDCMMSGDCKREKMTDLKLSWARNKVEIKII